MKRFVATLAVGTLVLGFGGAAFAQGKAKPPEAGGGAEPGVQYKQKTVYDFEDDMVEGDLQRPDGELVNSLRKTQHASLIEIRPNFIPEMLKSLEDL